MLLLIVTLLAQASTPSQSAVAADPMAEYVGKHYEMKSMEWLFNLLGKRWRVPVVFEGRAGPDVSVVMEFPPRGIPEDPVGVIEGYLRTDANARYRVQRRGPGFVVQVVSVRNPQGDWEDYTSLLDHPMTVDLTEHSVVLGTGRQLPASALRMGVFAPGGRIDLPKLIERGLRAEGLGVTASEGLGPYLSREQLQDLDGARTTPRALLELVPELDTWTWFVGNYDEVTPLCFGFYRLDRPRTGPDYSIAAGHLIAEEDGGGWDSGPPMIRQKTTLEDSVPPPGWEYLVELDERGIIDLDAMVREDPEGARRAKAALRTGPQSETPPAP